MTNIIRVSLLTISLFCSQSLFGQVIRKNWREMTTHEKDVYVSALRALYNKSPNVIETYVSTHNNSVYVQHLNSDFLFWHRMFIYYFEKELIASGVAGAANIALPYWGWETAGDWSASSPLFSSGPGGGNLGLFGYPIPEGTFSRGFGQSYTQPTAAELNALSTNFTLFGATFATEQATRFWPRLEATYHGDAHMFINGTMSNISISPRDPVFYQHHNYVDKIWQDWHNKNGSSSIAGQNVLINTVPGQPAILRSAIVDSRSLKVWYAYNGQVTLDNYTVTGTENYRYTGTFTIGNSPKNFIVPNGTTCNVISGTSVSLKPGFSAVSGSQLSVKIDAPSNPGSTFNTGRIGNDIAAVEILKEESELFTPDKFQVYPNPSTGGMFTIVLLTNTEVEYKYSVYDFMGRSIIRKEATGSDKQFEIDLGSNPAGVYILNLRMKNGSSFTKKLTSK